MIDYAVFSDPGERDVNEDNVRVFVNQPLFTYGFVLADGLGGHGNGDIASSIVSETVGAVLENSTQIGSDFLNDCFCNAQKVLQNEKETKGLASISTTMVVLVTNGNTASFGHIGDSRLYIFKKGKMIYRTLDHSVPQLLVSTGEIKESEIRHHPQRANVLSALGGSWNEHNPNYEVDEINRKMDENESYLLCSDGFWEWIEDKEMANILKKKLSAHECLEKMVSLIRSRGKGKNMDNFSAILIKTR